MRGTRRRVVLTMLLAAATPLAAGCEPAERGRAAAASGTQPRDGAAADTGTPGVSLRMAGRNDAVVLVPIHANGVGPLYFVLDSGATYTCVDDDLVEWLALDDRDGATLRGRGLGGEAEVGLVRIDSLRVGNILRLDLPACVVDLDGLEIPGTRVQGLLGLNFLRSFRVTLDFRRERMLLEPQ